MRHMIIKGRQFKFSSVHCTVIRFRVWSENGVLYRIASDMERVDNDTRGGSLAYHGHRTDAYLECTRKRQQTHEKAAQARIPARPDGPSTSCPVAGQMTYAYLHIPIHSHCTGIRRRKETVSDIDKPS